MLFMLILDWLDDIYIYTIYNNMSYLFYISKRCNYMQCIHILYIYVYIYYTYICMCKIIRNSRQPQSGGWDLIRVSAFTPLLPSCNAGEMWPELGVVRGKQTFFFFFDQLKFCSLAKKKGDIRTRYKMSQCSLNSHWRVNF